MSDSDKINNDYEYSRETYYELVEKGKQSLELMIEVARAVSYTHLTLPTSSWV